MRDIAIAGEVIASLDSGSLRDDQAVIDLGGRAVLPGLMDVHVHLAHSPIPQVDDIGVLGSDMTAFRALEGSRRLLAAGFTCVRDMGSAGADLFALRAASRVSLVDVPRLVLSGQILSATSIGSSIYRGMYDVADGAEGLRAAVRRQVARGADIIKVMADGTLSLRYDELGRAELTDEELAAIVTEARRLERPVACHAEGAGVELAVRTGVRSIEHAPLAHRKPELLEAMAASGTVLVPTLAAYDDEATAESAPAWLRERSKRTLEEGMATVGAALQRGVRIATGSDAEPATSSRREIELLADAGLTTAQILEAASSHAALACGLEGETGRLQPGLLADLVVLNITQPVSASDLGRPELVWAVLVGGELVAGTLEARAAFEQAQKTSGK